jgi:hypothetical protein
MSSINSRRNSWKNIYFSKNCVARRIDGTFPPGDHSHKELLEKMTLSIAGVRPPLINGATFVNIDRLRGFRHVFRNVYGFNLSPERSRDLLVELPATSSMIKKDIDEFIEKMESLLFRPGEKIHRACGSLEEKDAPEWAKDSAGWVRRIRKDDDRGTGNGLPD